MCGSCGQSKKIEDQRDSKIPNTKQSFKQPKKKINNKVPILKKVVLLMINLSLIFSIIALSPRSYVYPLSLSLSLSPLTSPLLFIILRSLSSFLSWLSPPPLLNFSTLTSLSLSLSLFFLSSHSLSRSLSIQSLSVLFLPPSLPLLSLLFIFYL